MQQQKSLYGIRLGIALLLASSPSLVFAGSYEYEGVATVCTTTCDSFAALTAPPTPSTLDGSVDIDVGTSDTFTFADVQAFGFLVTSPTAPLEPFNGSNPTTANPLPVDLSVAVIEETVTNPQGTFTTGGTTDANGEINSGTILFRFTVPPFSSNSAWVLIDAGTGQAKVCLFFATAGCLPGATESVIIDGSFSLAADADGDGVVDSADNCTNVANTGQQDTDGDGHGNICDGDFNNTCGPVNFLDLAIMRAGFFSVNALLDLDSSGGPVNFSDLAIMRGLFFSPPGPSAPGSLCNP